MARSKVVLPAPLGPRTATQSPGATRNDTSRSTGWSARRTVRFETRRTSPGIRHSRSAASMAYSARFTRGPELRTQVGTDRMRP